MNISKWIEDNIKPLLFAFVGVLIVCIAVGVWLELRRQREEKAQNFLYEAKHKVEKLTADKKAEEAQGVLLEVVTKFKGTHAAFDASLSLGDAYVENKKYEDALRYYQMAVDNAPDKFTKMLAIYNRGIAEEQSGKCDQAVKSYEAAIKSSEGDFLNPELLMAQARCWEVLGDKAKALSFYKEVREKFAGKAYYSTAAAVYQQKLSEAKN